MKARLLKPDETGPYEALARQYGTLFNRADWLALFGDRIQALGIFDEGGQMVGGVSLYQERRFGLRVFRRAPFTPTCGPFLEVKAQNPVAVLETWREAVESVAEFLDERSAAIVMMALDRRITDALPFYWRGYKVVPNYTYLIDLAPPLDQIRKNMSPGRRNDISKAARDGVTARLTTDMNVVRDLVLATFGRQEKHVDRPCLDDILFRYANETNSFAVCAFREERPIATCFVVHDGHIGYYLLGGYRQEDRHHGAGAVAVMEAIKHSQEIGLRTFDFEGSVIPAIERHFRGFGGQLTPYLTVNKAWLPLEMALKLRWRNRF